MASGSSDLDWVMMGACPLSADRLHLQKEAFEESDLPFRVDLFDRHALSEPFRAVVQWNDEVMQAIGAV